MIPESSPPKERCELRNRFLATLDMVEAGPSQ